MEDYRNKQKEKELAESKGGIGLNPLLQNELTQEERDFIYAQQL